MPASVRRAAALAAFVPLLAALVLGVAPLASAGIPVQTASVTITKVTDPASDPQDFQFFNNFIVSQQTSNTLDTDATSAGTASSYQFTVAQADFGFVIVSETVPSGWFLTDIQCTGDTEVSYNVDGDNVSLQADAGEIISCTFYNTKRAQLTVEKDTVPGTDPQDFHFDLTGDAVDSTLDLDTDPNSAFTGSNLTWSVLPDELGAYTITEAAATGWLLLDLTCTGAGNDSSVNLETRTATLDIDAGELVTCTFTNGKLPLLTITKVTVPASDPQDFDFEIPGDRTTTLDTDPVSEDAPSSETFSFGGAILGPRTILETAVDGWTLTDITCTEGSATATDLDALSVTIELETDSDIECVFTNTRDAEGTEPPATDEPTVEPTDESGGETNAPTEPGTSTESKTSDASPVGMGVALVALILLGGVLLLTRPKRAGK